MMEIFFEIVNMNQLEVLGFKGEVRYLLIFLLCIFLVSILVWPLIYIMIEKRFIYLLIYIISSLTILVIAYSVTMLQKEWFILKTAIQSVFIFGLGLTTYMIFQIFKENLQQK